MPSDLQKQQWAVQRKSPRHRVDMVVKVVAARKARNAETHAHCTDVSLGGMAVFSPVRLDCGEIIKIQFDEFALEAKVRNENGNRYGLEFATPEPERVPLPIWPGIRHS